MKYEYNTINNPTFLGDRLLNKLGDEGWELITHAYNSNTCDHFYTFKRVKIEKEPEWIDPMIEHLDREEKESEWQRIKRREVMKEARMNPNPVHYESKEITVEDIHKIHREVMEKEREEVPNLYRIDEIVSNNDWVGVDENRNPMYRYKGIYYTLDKNFKHILEERIERTPHWWWDALEPK